MTKSQKDVLNQLKSILEQAASPSGLDSHPWQNALFVQDELTQSPELADIPTGRRILHSIALVFKRLKPSAAPRRGKRLDTHWGEFGLLAAQYFAPVLFGHPFPRNLKEAWQKIDSSILLFEFGSTENISPEDMAQFILVGNELETAPNSTISDWHRKGLEYLAEAIYSHELHLSEKHNQPSPILGNLIGTPSAKKKSLKKQNPFIPWIKPVLISGLLIALLWLGFKGWRIFNLAQSVQQGLEEVQNIKISTENLENLQEFGPILTDLKTQLNTLDEELAIFYPILTALSWVPQYGGDIAAAENLLDVAQGFSAAGEELFTGGQPLLQILQANSDEKISPQKLTELLVAGQPNFQAARYQLDLAITARQKINDQSLSPRFRNLLQEKLDPKIPLIQDAVNLSLAAPYLLGAGDTGSRTYMLVLQNEDELRATGGFITAIGSMVVKDGQLKTLKIESSDELEDYTKFHPGSPWVLQEYFNIQILVLRDANWFADFPVMATYLEDLYALTRAHSVDGIIAIDQRFLVELLKVTGPVTVENYNEPISSENVIEYMRQAKIVTNEDGTGVISEQRKDFMGVLAPAILDKLLKGDFSPLALADFTNQALEERHLILQFDQSNVSQFLHKNNWDGSIQTGDDDFLMVLDSNTGYNKTNAVMSTKLSYTINLADVKAPRSSLVIHYKNNSPFANGCTRKELKGLENQKLYEINDCYSNYLRVLTPAGAQLTNFQAQAVPASMLRINRDIPARFDVLTDEEIPNAAVFGTYLIVGAGQSYETSLEYTLPSWVMTRRGEEQIYRLLIKKQPGTDAVPIQITIQLPAGATFVSATKGFKQTGDTVIFNRKLNVDQFIEVVFLLP